MANMFRDRVAAVKADLRAKARPSGWVLPRQASSFADEDAWSVPVDMADPFALRHPK